MSTFTRADDLAPLLERVKKQHHPDLVRYGVTVGLLYAHAARDDDDQPKGPALMHHGCQAAAVVRICPHKQRVAGLPDAEITVDGDRWSEWTEAQRVALLDHELTHLEVVIGEDGVKTDDSGRPKLRMRPHDIELGTFEEIIQRHRENALESAAFADAHKKFTQAQFPWGLT